MTRHTFCTEHFLHRVCCAGGVLYRRCVEGVLYRRCVEGVLYRRCVEGAVQKVYCTEGVLYRRCVEGAVQKVCTRCTCTYDYYLDSLPEQLQQEYKLTTEWASFYHQIVSVHTSLLSLRLPAKNIIIECNSIDAYSNKPVSRFSTSLVVRVEQEWEGQVGGRLLIFVVTN